MLELGFKHDMNQLVRKIRQKRQTLFFSATINEHIKDVAYALVQKAIRIQISPKDPVSKNIVHSVANIEMDDKRFFLERIIKENPDKEWSVEERLSYIIEEPPVNPPGEGWAYADSHYLILGLIIEKVTGRSYYEVLDELILEPCNLKHTFHSDRRSIPGLIPGYTNLTEEFQLPHKVLNDNRYAFNPQMEWTGGGLVSTVSDLTSWACQLYGGGVLKPETLKLMLTPAPFETSLFENAGYGLGSFIAATEGVTYYGHTGFVPGYITYVQYLPDYNISLALQVNDDSSHENFSLKKYFNIIRKVVLDRSYPTSVKRN